MLLTGIADIWILFILLFCGYNIAGLEYLLCSILLGIGKGRSAAVYLAAIFRVTIIITYLYLNFNLRSQPHLNPILSLLRKLMRVSPFCTYKECIETSKNG